MVWTVCLRARTIVTLCLRRCVSCQHCKSIVWRKRGLGTDHVDRLDPLHGVQAPSPALFNRRECKRCNLSPDLFRVFSSFLFLSLLLFPNDGCPIARARVQRKHGSRPRTDGSPFFSNVSFSPTPVFNRVSRTEVVRKHSSARGERD